MDEILVWQIGYLLVAAAELALFFYVLRLLKRGRKVKIGDAIILAPLLLALVYDNTMLGIGDWLGESEAHRLLSGPRYITHAMMTPLLLVFATLCADRLGVPGFRNNREKLTVWGGIAFFIIWYGLWNDLVHMELGWDTSGDAGGRYAHHGHVGPPIPVMVTGLGLILIGASIQRHARTPWVVLSSVNMLLFIMFIDNGVIINVGELLLLLGLVATGTVAISRYEKDKAARREAALAGRRDTRETVGTG
jgi:hypothetical protein